MKTVGFEGFSDDNFGPDGDIYDNCAENKPIRWLLKSCEGECVIIGHYFISPDATWTIGITNREEGRKIPNWPIRMMDGNRPYSPRLEIDVPDDTIVVCLENTKELE